MGLRFWALGLGFGVWDLGFGLWGLGFRGRGSVENPKRACEILFRRVVKLRARRVWGIRKTVSLATFGLVSYENLEFRLGQSPL